MSDKVYIVYCEGIAIDVYLTLEEAKSDVDKYYLKELYSIREMELLEEY